MNLIARYDALAIDLDGVVWRGGTVLPGVIEAFGAIRAAGTRILILTNNAQYSPEFVVNQLGAVGIEVREAEVLGPVEVAREVLKRRGLWGRRAQVLGAREVSEQLLDSIVPVEVGMPTDVVIVGRYVDLNYENLTMASDAIREGAFFLAMNRDSVLPVDGGYLPGTGAIVAALEVASGVSAFVVGKPNAPMMQAARARLGVERVLMIGDRADSDIAGAISIGWDSALVGRWVEGPRPTYQVDSLAQVVAMSTIL